MTEVISVTLLALLIMAFFYFRTRVSSDIAKENVQIGKEFLKINKSKSGIIETNTGLQYRVLNKGNENKHPTIKDQVKVHFHGMLLDNRIFDSSLGKDKAASFSLKQVIKGLREGLQLMIVGEKTRFFIPSYLAYGNQSNGKVEAGSLLIIEVELISIN